MTTPRKKTTRKKATTRKTTTRKKVAKKAPAKKAAAKKVTKKTAAKTTAKKPKRGRVPRSAPTPEISAEDDARNGVVALDDVVKRAPDEPADPEHWLPWYRVFLDALRTEYSVTGAAAVAGVSRRTAQRHRKKDEQFSMAWEASWESIVDELEASAMRRATRGTVEPIMFKDQRVGAKRVFETSLTIFMLKRNRKGKYEQNLSEDERDARDLAREFREAMQEMDDTVPEWTDEDEKEAKADAT